MNQTLRLMQIFIFGFCVAAMTSLSGCGNGHDIDLYPVTGTVTIDGNPVEGAMVNFQPTGEGRAPRGAAAARPAGTRAAVDRGRRAGRARDMRGADPGRGRPAQKAGSSEG